MVRSIQSTSWTAGFFAVAGAMPEDDENPAVLVMETSARMARMIIELCEFMSIRMLRVADQAALRRSLWTRRPIGVLCNLTEFAESQDCSVLKLVADYDRSLPTLLVSDAHPTTLGTIDAVEDLCRMTNVTRLTTAPGAFEIVEFMFHAGRHSGRRRLLPV